ncbi:MAG: phosphoribosyl-ATP diphosphatase [Eubacteriales bacterium]|nr:phosphoribosyl-ATP diphosphatase [Eubacteriales bacterium]
MKNAFQLLYDTVIDRKENPMEGSYTNYLFDEGVNKILKKCGEECSEVLIAAKDQDQGDLKNEICDLLYHLMVLMVQEGIALDEIEDILKERSNKIGNKKKMHETDRNS